jgi:hypothetical protein
MFVDGASVASTYPLYWLTSRIGIALVKRWPLKPVAEEFRVLEVEPDQDNLQKLIAEAVAKQRIQDQVDEIANENRKLEAEVKRKRDEYVHEMDKFRGRGGDTLVEAPDGTTIRVDDLQRLTPEYEAYLQKRRVERDRRRMGWSGTKAVAIFSRTFAQWQLEHEVAEKPYRLQNVVTLDGVHPSPTSITRHIVTSGDGWSGTSITGDAMGTTRSEYLARKYRIPT